MRVFSPTKRTVIIIVLSITIVCVAGFLFWEFQGLPDCEISNRKQAADAFKNYLDGIDEILEPYGLQCAPYEVMDTEFSYHVITYVHLDRGELLYISLDYTVSNNYPPEFIMFLDSATSTNWDECRLDLEQYPYVYDIAAYLCDDRFSAEQYCRYLTKVQNRVEKRRQKGETGWIGEYRNLKSMLFSLGRINYSLETEGDMHYAEASINMFLYD